MKIVHIPIEATSWEPNKLFEYMTGREIKPEPKLDRLEKDGRIDPSDAEGFSMGDGMDALVLRVIKTKQAGLSTDSKQSLSFHPTTRREMLETVDIPEGCRFESEDIKETSVDDESAPRAVDCS